MSTSEALLQKNGIGVEQQRTAMARIAEYVDRALHNAASAIDTLAGSIAVVHLARARNVLRAVGVVADLRLPTEVSVLGRVLCEAAYSVTWVLQEKGKDRAPEERERHAQMLIDEAVLEQARLLRKWSDHGYSRSEEEVIKAENDASKTRQRLGLAGNGRYELPNALDRAVQSGIGEENYDLFYRQMCLDSHPTLHAGVRALEGEGDYELDRSLFLVNASALGLVDACSQLMRREDFHELKAAYYRALGIEEPKPA